MTDFSHLPKRVRLKLRKQMRTKAWSDAARAAAIAKRRANAAARGQSPSEAAREAAHIRAEGERQARAIRAAGGVNRALPKPKGGKGGKGKGGGKGGKPKVPPKAKLTPEQRAQQRQAAQAKQRQANHDAVKQAMAKQDVGIAPKGFDNLIALGTGTEPDQIGAESLTKMGLAERGGDGVLRLTASGRAAVAAADRGDAKAAIDAISKAGDLMAAARQRATARQQRQIERQQRQAAAAERHRQVEARRRAAEKRRRARRKTMDVALKAGSPGDYLVVEDPQKPSTWHLQVRTNGKPDHHLMGAAWAALHGGYRGNTYQGPNKTEAISKLRALYRSEKMPVPGEKADSSFTVFKDAAGGWRWLAVSSSAYRDRDGEIVSTKALENAVSIADATGLRGPLRWWHVGVPFGPGLDLGDCDFQAVQGRFLVESGTFKSEAFALAFKDTDDEVSIGFTHPPDAPDTDKTFGDVPIVIFERSLAPRGRVSNLFTSFTTTKEVAMNDEKTAALKERIGEDLLSSLLGNIATTDAKAEKAGIAFKADDPDAVAALVAALKADPSLLETAIKAMGGMDMGGDMAAEAETPDETAAEGGVEEPGDENMLTAAECQQIADTVAQAVVAQLQPLLNIEQKIQDHAKGISDMIGSTFAQKDAAQAEKDKLIAELKAQQQQLDARLKELEGDAPASIKAGFKASESAATIVNPASPLAQSAPTADPLADFLSTFVVGGGQPPVAH